VRQWLQDRRAALGLSLAVILVLGCLDYLTALEFDIFLFYALPVSLTAWFVGRVPAVVPFSPWWCGSARTWPGVIRIPPGSTNIGTWDCDAAGF
jgi:hypothetical protein